MNNPTGVDLQLAVFFNCPSCGKGQFKKLVPAELNQVQRNEMIADYELDPRGLDSLMVAPKRIRCRHCKAKLKVENI